MEINRTTNLLQVFQSIGFHPATGLSSRQDDLLTLAVWGRSGSRETQKICHDRVCLLLHHQTFLRGILTFWLSIAILYMDLFRSQSIMQPFNVCKGLRPKTKAQSRCFSSSCVIRGESCSQESSNYWGNSNTRKCDVFFPVVPQIPKEKSAYQTVQFVIS